ncbi:MAG: phosphotransferase [Candidatus Nomurabacteria bacterium]|jgi:Ser/Thr protein kinase RdoA (MazF antagonist)|nr:phosphotransferase [Candidatus Nomurabacteria bacterium]
MNQVIAERAAKFYGLNVKRIAPPQSGYRNQSYRILMARGRQLNLIFFKREAGILQRIERADTASELAAKAGLPTRRRADPRTLKLAAADGRNFYARLYDWLPGATIPWENYTRRHLKLLGWAMSDLHNVLRDFSGDLPSAAARAQNLNRQMTHYFSDQNVRRALRQKLDLKLDVNLLGKFGKIFDLIDAKKSGRIPLHMDLVRGNILFAAADETVNSPWRLDDLALSGVIDFEKIARGRPEWDLARTLAFLLVDVAGKTPRRIWQNFIWSGYFKRGAYNLNWTAALKRRIWQLTRWFLLYDFYKFLRHNPYESLKLNHHYKRTRDILLTKNMLQLSKAEEE